LAGKLVNSMIPMPSVTVYVTKVRSEVVVTAGFPFVLHHTPPAWHHL
jgi:hypothetical protein